jgi:hypothetical protein
MELLSMKYHVVTPFSRPENFDRLQDMLRLSDVDWHLLIDDPPKFALHYEETWIRQYLIPKIEPPWAMWRRCILWFAESSEIVDDDRYLIMADDCCYEPNFFQKIDQHSGDVVICSMKRGDNIPPGVSIEKSHGTETLVASPGNMHPCQVSAEQIILSGRLFKQIQLPDQQNCDGMMIEKMAQDHPVVYVPDAFVWFNYLEPGRWNGIV